MSDFHANPKWFHWLLSEAPQHDLIAFAGDILDSCDPKTLPQQKTDFANWVKEFEKAGVPLAVCSGNHDNDHPFQEPVGARWIRDCLPRSPLFVGDGETRILAAGSARLVVTAIPFNCNQESAWEAGRMLASDGLPWIVLHHEPPQHTKVGGPMGDWSVCQAVEDYQPHVLLSGHLHDQPFTKNGAPWDYLGRTLCVNPGQPDLNADAPCRVLIEFDGAVWKPRHERGRGRSPSAKKSPRSK